MADLEAYIGNGARGSADAKANVTSKLDDVAGPGHNGFMMICAALVLFMTLPGLAGIVLTIGMAVDANILIFERMREELAAGTLKPLPLSGGFEELQC